MTINAMMMKSSFRTMDGAMETESLRENTFALNMTLKSTQAQPRAYNWRQPYRTLKSKDRTSLKVIRLRSINPADLSNAV